MVQRLGLTQTMWQNISYIDFYSLFLTIIKENLLKIDNFQRFMFLILTVSNVSNFE
jgi:hypothetical protein